jgi:hypothetical protein
MVKIEKADEIIVGVIKNITHTIREELIPYRQILQSMHLSMRISGRASMLFMGLAG